MEHIVGAWNTVYPAEGSATVRNILGMQTVYNVILPSGKVLMISGSSWRNKDLPLSDTTRTTRRRRRRAAQSIAPPIRSSTAS